MTAVAQDPSTAKRGRTPTVVRLLVLATFVVILNETLMINAIPRLMESLQVSEQAAQWVSTAFMLTMAAVIPITGWFLQRVTTKQAYATAMREITTGLRVGAEGWLSRSDSNAQERAVVEIARPMAALCLALASVASERRSTRGRRESGTRSRRPGTEAR